MRLLFSPTWDLISSPLLNYSRHKVRYQRRLGDERQDRYSFPFAARTELVCQGVSSVGYAAAVANIFRRWRW